MDQSLTRRIYLIGFVFLALCLGYFQIIKGDYFLSRAQNNYVRVLPSPSLRGTITDRTGIPLAYDKASFNIAVIPYQIRQKQNELFSNVAHHFGVKKEILYANYRRNLQNYFSPVNILVDITKPAAFSAKETFGDDIVINPRPQRYYPYPFAFAHVLGYVQEAQSFYETLKRYGYQPRERVGQLGVEQYYDTYLKGDDGGDLIEVDSKGTIVGFLGTRKPIKGKDLQLTLDQRMQMLAYEALKGKKGVVILLDVQTGAIRTLVSYPAFNPHSFVRKDSVSAIINDPANPMINRAIQARYPLGSTFKPLLALAALETKKITSTHSFTCLGEYRMGNTVFRCSGTHGKQNMYAALGHSCNVYFYHLGLRLGANALSEWARLFGLDRLTGVDLPYEKKGFVPTKAWKKKVVKESWYDGDTLNFSIGQGFLAATPLETLVAITAFANGGYLLRPHILESIAGVPSERQDFSSLGVSSDTLRIVRKGLRDAVRLPDGTARVLERLNLDIAGKTGTAQTTGKPHHGWFVGFFPFGTPRYSICVFLENGGSSHEAVKVAYYFLKRAKEENLLEKEKK